MRIITPYYWKFFNTEKISKHNGFHFEDLIEVLLNLEFGDMYWRKTRPIKDGGRDFVYKPLPNQWAECKMHDNRIQLTVISKTLVMAINEGVKRIIFFSYSKLTRGASQELSRFSCAAGIIIQVFDDELLEELILRNIKDPRIQQFFPDFVYIDSPKRLARPLLKQFFSKEIEISSNQVLTNNQELKPRSNRVDVKQPCLFELIINAQSIKDINVQLDVSKLVQENNWFILLNAAKLHINKKKLITKRLSPGEVCAFRFYFAPIITGVHVFPSFPVIFGPNKRRTTPVRIDVSRTERPILIGQCVHKYLDKFHKDISSSNYVQASIVFGNSGVGKSRFIEECITHLLKEGYMICSLDGKNSRYQNVNKFVRELLVQLWRIPNPDIFDDAYTFESAHESCDEFENKMYNVMKRGLGDTLYQESDLSDICFLLEKIIINKRIAILLDNVQSLDDMSLLLIDKIFDLIGRIGQSHFLLSFNKEELIYSQKASQIFFKFIEQQSNRNIHLYKLQKFSKDDMRMFVDSHLKGIDSSITFSKQYPLLFEKICKHIHPSPLDLYLFFKYLWDEQIAILDNGIFFITDFQRFNDTLTELTPTLRDILSFRLNKLEHNEEALRIFLLLSFIGDSPIQEIIQQIHVSYKSIETLVEGCWLRHCSSGRVDFYHPKIANFLLEKNALLIEKQGNVIAKYLKQGGYNNRYPILNFTLAEYIDKHMLFDAALQQIKRVTIANSRNQMLAQHIYNYILSRTVSELLPSSYLPYIHHICHLVSKANIATIIDCFDRLNNLLENYNPSLLDVNYVFQIIRQHASYLCTIDPYQSIKILEKGLLRLNCLGDEYEPQKKCIKVNLINRLSYCYRTISNKSKAEEIGLEALRIAERLGDVVFICLCNIDLGYIYYGEENDKNNLLKYWKKAIQCYQEHEEYLLNHEHYLAYSCILLESYITAIENNDYSKAYELSTKLVLLSREKTDCLHHEILGLQAKATWAIKQNIRTDVIISIIDAMIDRCLITYDNKNLIKAYHLKAIVLDKKGEKELAQSHFLYALKILANKKYYSISDKALLWDATAFYHKQNIKLPSLISSIDTTLWEQGKDAYFKSTKWEMRLFMLFKDKLYNYPV